MNASKKQSGFTLFEMVIVVIILGILMTIVTSSFVAYKNRGALKETADAVVANLLDARTKSLTSKNALSYGIHFTSTTTTLFSGATYSASDPINETYALPSGVTLTTNIPGGGSDITFSRITGEINQSGTATVTLTQLATSTSIRVYKTGTIEKIP